MIDIEKLKVLAESATQGEWGYYGSYVCTARIEAGTKYVETWSAVADCSLADNTKFIAAANPAAVLELISEIDKSRFDRGNSMDENCLLAEERDQLKAENLALRKDLDSHKRMLLRSACDLGVIGEALGAEMDDDGSELVGIATELRKDAELFDLIASDAESGLQKIYGYDWISAVDAAMGKGEQP